MTSIAPAVLALAVASALSLIVGDASAQAAPAGEPAIVVTATRFPERRLDAPIGMTVITAREIAQRAARNLPELLSQEAGLVFRDNTGSPDWQADLRGFGITGDQNTLVLLNGQRLSEIELVSNRWSAIPLDAIERIEILRGSGAVLYGGGATGGAINIITRAPGAATAAATGTQARSATLGGSLGSYGTHELRASASLARESLGLSLHANDYASDNYRVNNRVEQQNVDGEARLSGARGHLAFRFGADNQNLQLPGPRSRAQLESDRRGTATPRDFASRDGARASLGGAADLGFGELAAELSWRDSARTSLQRDYVSGLFDTYVDTRVHVWSFTPRLKIPFEGETVRQALILGLDFDDWDYASRRASSLETLGAPSADVLAGQRDQAFYVQHHLTFGDTKLDAGARWQRVSLSARDRVNPAAYASARKTSTPRAWEIGLRHDFTPRVSAYGRLGESFRVATVDEVYSQFGGPLFDAIVSLLEPQTSRDREIGVELRPGRLRLRASLFASRLDNEIYFFAPAFANINLPPTERRGIELDAKWQPRPALSLFANASAVQARFREGVIGGIDVSGNTIPLVPRATANAGFAWHTSARTQWSGVLRWVGRQRYDNDQANTFPLMPAYTVADLKFSHDFGRATLGVAVNNLFDRRYYSYAIRSLTRDDFNAYPQRERNLLVTLEYRL